MNKKWKRTTVLGGFAVFVLLFLWTTKKNLNLCQKNFNFVG